MVFVAHFGSVKQSTGHLSQLCHSVSKEMLTLLAYLRFLIWLSLGVMGRVLLQHDTFGINEFIVE